MQSTFLCRYTRTRSISRACNLAAEPVNQALSHQRDIEHVMGPEEIVLSMYLEQFYHEQPVRQRTAEIERRTWYRKGDWFDIYKKNVQTSIDTDP